MELLDRYLHALKTDLPKAQQRDILLNLWRTAGRQGANLVTAGGTHARS